MNFRTIQQNLAGKFHRVDYNHKFITVKLVGDLSTNNLTSEQLTYIKTFYDRPDSKVETLSSETLRLII